MVIDAAGPNFHFDSVTEASSSKPLNFEAKRFSDMLAKADEPLFEGCEKHSILSATSMMLNIKADYNMSESCYDRIMQAFKDFIPNSQFCSSFYETKKMVSHLGLGYKKIDVCPNGCMIYYMEDEGRCECYRCGHPRYKPNEPSRAKKKNKPFKYMHYLPLAPRLQRLYMSKDTAKSMTWHHENKREPGVLSHPSDGEAWKHFDRTHPSFAVEPRNVRLGLCADGFTPFGMSSASYSCWPVIVTPYNLPPWLCMKYQYMLLTLIIPGPHCPKRNIDVFLKPLIHELVQLWEVGVDTYDAFREQNFRLKATLMWTINDFPAYGMLSGWSTHGRLSCPYCMERSKAFTLKHGRKPSFFDCHRQFLPLGHSFRSDKDAFKKGRVERDEPPPRLSGAEIWRRVREYPRVIDQHYPFGKELMGFGVLHNWTKRSIFWDLPSWPTNLIIEEISNFCSHYFEAYVETNLTRVGRNDDRPDVSSSRERLSIFKHPVRLSGGCKRRYLDDEELRVAILYVLQNCEEIQPILKIFEAELKVENPNMTSDELNDFIEKRFGSWLRDYARNPQNSHMVNDQITNLAIGPSRSVRTWHMCFVNGFNFHTLYHSYGRKTTNTDVCVIGEEGEYYGRLIDVIELDYKGCSQLNTIVLFKCEWFDPVKNRGWKIHSTFGVVDINHRKKLQKYDPFVMAHQAQQVYFIRYPSMRRNKVDWLAVCKTKARSTIVAPPRSMMLAYQEDTVSIPFIVTEHDEFEPLVDDAGDMEEVEVKHLEDEVNEKDNEEEEVEEEDDYEEEEDEIN